jgi:NTP pyrophosphatase (non-canonical NTP hydrolase)
MNFIVEFEQLEKMAFAIAKSNGFREEKKNDGEAIALMHSELSEALEALRVGNPPSEHIPKFSALEEELADVIIRIMNYSFDNTLQVAGALIEKMKYNATREHRHGGKLF